MGKKSIFIVISLLFSIIFSSFISPINLYAASQPFSNRKTIRVGYPIQSGLTMKDSSGKLSGYTYDYLMEISQYTGWNYEFVFIEDDINAQLMGFMDMLEKGEIDLLGSMNYNPMLAEMYSYPGLCYGINYYGLYVDSKSRLNEASLYNINKIRIGVFNKSLTPNETLEQFAKMNNLNIEQVITDSFEEFTNMLDKDTADALLATDLSMANKDDRFPIVHFSPTPFYFATTKGNTDIVRQLDYAISTIDKVNPNFMPELYNHYFSPVSEDIIFSYDEQYYINNTDPLDVVIYDNKPPFQYIDKKTRKPAGIAVEVLEHISKLSGLKFNYNTVSTYEDYKALTLNGDSDISAEAITNFQDAIDLNSALTLPWYSLPVTVISREDSTPHEEDRLAIPYFLRNIIPYSDKITYYNSAEECMKAIRKNDVDYAYIDEFASQYYFNTLEYSELKRYHQSDIPAQKYCFAINDSENINLIGIFNKSISSISSYTLDEIVYRNTYLEATPNLWKVIKSNRNLMLASITSTITLIFIVFMYVKKRQQKRIEFENQRYQVISNLANEYFYEYNIDADVLVLSDKCAEFFDCDKKISKFSNQIAKINSNNIFGIWQVGAYILDFKEGSAEFSCQMKDNSRQWLQVVSSVLSYDKKNAFAVGKILNIHDAKSEQIRLEQQAATDGLTGIYNISKMRELISERLENIEAFSPSAFIILDIDDFKHINDTFGHYSGDTVLVQLAKTISRAFPDDLVGRLGGDEFVIFASHTSHSEIEECCNEIMDNFAGRTSATLGTRFSCSMGITYVKPDKDYDVLYKEADSALYKAKSLNKNRYMFFGE